MARKKATATATATATDSTPTTDTTAEPRDAATGRPRTGAEQEIAVDDGSGPEPHEINSSLDSDRMRALLEEHRAMGSRP